MQVFKRSGIGLATAGLLLLSACTCKVAKVQRLLVGQGNVGCWTVAATIKNGDTTFHEKKHILLFSRKGYYNDYFRHNGQYTTSHSTGFMTNDVVYPDTWRLEDASHLLLNGGTTTIVQITRDTLVLSNFDLCMTCDQMIYVRKTNLGDVDPDIIEHIP
jgi:hypothetical protein